MFVRYPPLSGLASYISDNTFCRLHLHFLYVLSIIHLYSAPRSFDCSLLTTNFVTSAETVLLFLHFEVYLHPVFSCYADV